MPRGDHKIPDSPYGTWIVRVDERNRIRLPSEIRTVVAWLSSESGTIDCVGTPGPVGGVQLEPVVTHETLRRRFIEALRDSPPEAWESGQKWVDAARFLATSWLITIRIESSRFEITLPEPTRQMLQLPGAGGIVVVFGFGAILEVWDSVKWHEHTRAVAKTKLSAVSEAIEDLGHR